MTDILKTANELLDKWVGRIHVADWQIKVGVEDFGEEECSADILINPWRRMANIKVREDCPSWTRGKYPVWEDETDEQLIERSIVHELIHLSHSTEQSIVDEYMKEILEEGKFTESIRLAILDLKETTVNQVTRILIEADRSGGWTK